MRQIKLNEVIKSGDFKIGDRVQFVNRNPDYILVIKKFVDKDYVSLCLPDGEKGFSAFCYTGSLEKLIE